MRAAAAAATIAAASLLHTTAADVDVSPFVFLNRGSVGRGDWWPSVSYPVQYAEPENVTRTDWSWADVGMTDELFTPGLLSKGVPDKLYTGTDLPGQDYAQLAGLTQPHCSQACIERPACMAWVHTAEAPSALGPCAQGQPCCYLKSGVPEQVTKAGITSGTVLHPHIGSDDSPPVGVRSAPPLGGVAAGTVELRADGTFAAWTLENNSPAGSAKVPQQRRTFLGARVSGATGDWARVLQTSPLGSLPAVDGLEFSGSPPVSRLGVRGTPAGVGVALLGYSSLVSGDMASSHLPAIAFSFEFTNNLTTGVSVAGFFQLQGHFDDVRRDGAVKGVLPAADADECAGHCNADEGCATFTFSPEGVCTLQSDAPLYAFGKGWASGTRSVWSATTEGCLVVDKPGSDSMHGNYSMCGDSGAVSMATGDTEGLWQAFQKQGTLDGLPTNATAPHGAIAVSAVVPPQSTKVVTVVLGYYFPNRGYLTTPVGNQYSRMVGDAEEAARTMRQRLPEVVAGVAAVHTPILNSSLPRWMRDTLVGSLHHTRSAWWGADGRWRQWEAYDCVNVDSVHNDGERHVPYLMLFPDSVKSKMEAWGKGQAANGMIQEQLACGCTGSIDTALDRACGRVMSDVSSMYIVYLAELLRWHNDTAFVAEWYPTAQRAADWHISVSTYHGMPEKLQTTYDIIALNRYSASTYSTVFHMLAMRAMQDLAGFMGDDASAYKAAEDAAREGLETQMWDEDLGAYIAYTGGRAIFADSFYAQVLAYSLGYGALSNTTRMRLHLATEARTNYDPFGLQILTGRETQNTIAEKDIWMMAPADHSTLRLRLQDGTPDEALEVAARSYIWLTEGAKDVWKAAGVLRGNYSTFGGMTMTTTHYGYYMTVWHTMLAMSGQVADLATKRVVSFAPVLEPPFSLPMMLPGVVGYVNATAGTGSDVTASLCLTAGTLSNVQIAWWSFTTGTRVSLAAGQCVSASGAR